MDVGSGDGRSAKPWMIPGFCHAYIEFAEKNLWNIISTEVIDIYSHVCYN